MVMEFSGVAASPADGSVNAVSIDNSQISQTSGTLTTANANDVLVYGVGAGGNQTAKTAGCRQCDGHGWTISITGGAVPCESCGLGKAISRGLTDLGRKKGKKSRRYTAQDIGIPED